jgi:annexin A7/11
MEHAEEAAKSLHKAMRGVGTDENRLIKEIVTHPNGARQLIKEKYLTMYGKTLEEEIKSEIGGKFLDGVLALLVPTDEYEAKCLKGAIKGIGTNEKDLIQIICPKETHEIEVVKAAYKRLYNHDLEKDLANEEKGPLGKIFRSIASAGRAESRAVDQGLANKEAQELYDAGEGTFGTDESAFVRILCMRSFPQLNATFNAYSKISGHDIEKAIKKEMGGDLEKACLAIVKSAKNKSAYFAEALHEAMDGVGTKDDDLIRILVTRSENDITQIKAAYKSIYGKNLYDVVKSELSGDYEKLFLNLIGK